MCELTQSTHILPSVRFRRPDEACALGPGSINREEMGTDLHQGLGGKSMSIKNSSSAPGVQGPKFPSFIAIRSLGFYVGIVAMVGAKYSLLEVLDPLGFGW